MSRMYGTLTGDSVKERTLGGSESMEAQINWGSRDNSRKAVNVLVTWGNGEDAPTVYVSTGSGIKELIVNGTSVSKSL